MCEMKLVRLRVNPEITSEEVVWMRKKMDLFNVGNGMYGFYAILRN